MSIFVHQPDCSVMGDNGTLDSGSVPVISPTSGLMPGECGMPMVKSNCGPRDPYLPNSRQTGTLKSPTKDPQLLSRQGRPFSESKSDQSATCTQEVPTLWKR